MTSTERIWITPQAHSRLHAELNELRTHRDVLGSAGLGNTTEDGGVERAAVRARIRRIHDVLRHAVVGETPPDDGVAEPGMVLTVRYDDTGDTETFLLAVRDVEDGAIEVYSTQSPLGHAMVGARPGQQRTYRIPSGATVAVTLLDAVPYGGRDEAHEPPRTTRPHRVGSVR
jgi:transcription elongation factor GreA